MRIFVAITDQDWFDLHTSRAQVEEVNFWRPSPTANSKALQPGELMLFKLHSPLNFIAGGGFFTRFLHLPLSLAWDSFGEANGVTSIDEMRKRIARYRHVEFAPNDNPNVGCIMLAETFFWPRELWIPSPPEFSLSNQVGMGFDAEFPSDLLISPHHTSRVRPQHSPPWSPTVTGGHKSCTHALVKAVSAFW
jgi:putative restriction endonuclease